MGRRTSAESSIDSETIMVEDQIGPAYANVKTVAENITAIVNVSETFAEITDPVTGVTAQAAIVTTKAAEVEADRAAADAARIAAETAETNAELAETNAETAQAAAAASAAAASVSATNAAASAATAQTAAAAIPTGGTINQVLAKASNANYDYQWQDQVAGGLTNGDKGDVIVSDVGATLIVESATPSSGTFPVTGSGIFSGYLRHGPTADTPSATPSYLSSGGAYYNGASPFSLDALKWRLYEAADYMGLGISSLRFNFSISHAAYSFVFGIAGVEKFRISDTQATSAVKIIVPDDAYDTTGWDEDLSVPTKNAIRDKIVAIENTIVGAMKYQGTWNATTNSPVIPAASTSNSGHYYKVATAGTTSIDGIADWGIGDWIVSNGTSWDKIDNSELVSSVAGLVGAITAGSLKTALSLVKADVGLGNVDNTSDANKPVSAAQQAALDAKSNVRPTIGTLTASRAAADSDNNSHLVASGAAQTLTLGNITAGTSFTVRFTTAWSLASAGGLSKNGVSPSGVTTGSVAADSLITFLHEGAGVWLASGQGLT